MYEYIFFNLYIEIFFRKSKIKLKKIRKKLVIYYSCFVKIIYTIQYNIYTL